MKLSRRLSGGFAVILLGAGLSMMGSPAAASSNTSDGNPSCRATPIRGSAGHHGLDVVCPSAGEPAGASFYAVALCQRFDNAQNYVHYGPRVRAGATSRVWCALGAFVRDWDAYR